MNRAFIDGQGEKERCGKRDKWMGYGDGMEQFHHVVTLLGCDQQRELVRVLSMEKHEK